MAPTGADLEAGLMNFFGLSETYKYRNTDHLDRTDRKGNPRALRILEQIKRDDNLRESFYAFLKRAKVVHILKFAVRLGKSGDLYKKYFAPNPRVNVNLSPKFFKEAQDLFKNAERDFEGRKTNLDKVIADECAKIFVAMKEKAKLEKTDKNGNNKKKIAKLDSEIEKVSKLVKKLARDPGALKKEKPRSRSC